MNKFSKYIHLVSERENFTAENWTDHFFNQIFWFWKLSEKIISDWDSKFIRTFWQTLFKRCKIILKMITVYYSSLNDQTERTNQTVKTVLHCLLIEQYKKKWKNLLLKIEFALNTSTNAFTESISFELLYKISAHIILDSLNIKNKKTAEDFITNCSQIWAEIMNALLLVKVKMMTYYNRKHQSIQLTEQIYVKIAWSIKHRYKLSESSVLFIKKIDSFWIIKWVSLLVYNLDLSKSMKIHSVISIIHLKQAQSNLYHHTISSSVSVLMNKEKEWVIDKILGKWNWEWKGMHYHVRWKEYDDIT